MKQLTLGVGLAALTIGYTILDLLASKLFEYKWGKTKSQMLHEALHNVSAHEAKVSWLDSKKTVVN